MFERLREAIEAALEAATPAGNPRDVVTRMHAAVVEAKVAVEKMREGVELTEQRLTRERTSLEDAERRGRMATDIGDSETADVAEQFATKHRERLAVLEHKLVAQREELALAQRELAEMRDQLDRARRDHRLTDDSHVREAWRDLNAGAAGRTGDDLEDEVLRAQFDRAAREQRAEEQLKALKKKMGK
jgi:hypothetical protein